MAVKLDGFRRALKAALVGPDIKDVEWTSFGHDFNVKKAVITKSSNGLTIDGSDGHHISHRLRFRPDDQLFYKCRVTPKGQVEDLEISIKSSTDILKEWFKTAGEIIGIVGAIVAATKADAALAAAEPTPASEELLDGDWQSDAEFLIANIIHYAVAREMPDIATRTSSIPAFGSQRFAVNPSLIVAFADAKERMAGL